MEALQLDANKLATVSEESKSLFYCVLSLCNWVELAQVRISYIYLFYYLANPENLMSLIGFEYLLLHFLKTMTLIVKYYYFDKVRNSYDPSIMNENIKEAISQFGVAMNRYGYPTATSLYSSLVFYLSWADLVSSYGAHPSTSISSFFF